MPDVYTPTAAPSEHHYLYEHLSAKALHSDPFQTRLLEMFILAAEVPKDFEHLEIWATKFSYPGPDHEILRFVKDGATILEHRIEGH